MSRVRGKVWGGLRVRARMINIGRSTDGVKAIVNSPAPVKQ